MFRKVSKNNRSLRIFKVVLRQSLELRHLDSKSPDCHLLHYQRGNFGDTDRE